MKNSRQSSWIQKWYQSLLVTAALLGVSATAFGQGEMSSPEQAPIYESQVLTPQELNEIAANVGTQDVEANRRFACYARDALRVTYRVIAWGRPGAVQREAVRYCRNVSRVPWTCRAIGCQ